MKRLVLRAKAETDLEHAYNWYEREREGLGDEFLAEVRKTLSSVLRMPESCPKVHRQTRRALVHRFPYGLYYRIIDETVVLVACFHTRRHPAGWKRRR